MARSQVFNAADNFKTVITTPAWKPCPAVRSASSVCSSHLRHLRREASQLDDPPKDRCRNVMFPLDI